MAQDTFSLSLWSALTPPAGPASPLTGEASADVVVVGAGFLGLSTALHLGEGGARVALLEAEEPGFGASGRNTGFVVPSLRTSLGPADVHHHLGEAGERLTRLVGASGDAVFDLIARHGIDCSAERTGWLQPAHTADMLRVLQQRQADWTARGRSVEILSPAETTRRVGAPGYHGALFDPTGGQINPLAYARGLAAAAQRRGVSIHAASRVERIERRGSRWLVSAAHGRVTAERVLLTTNALVGRLAPTVDGSLIPVQVHQIATRPLSAELRASIMPSRSPVADTRRHTFAVRWSPDGRLVTGGLVLPGPGRRERAMRYFSRRLERAFPAAAPIRADYVWSGVIAATLDSLPRFMSLEPGLDAVLGCNGRGIALTTALGRAVAALYGGNLGLDEFPLPHLPPKPVPAGPLTRHGPMVWLPWSDLRDRFEIGKT